MDILIVNNSEKPIYEQIKEQIKNLIIAGELKEGEVLPSMRLLAKELRISMITTKRAYEELEREGYIMSFTGKGSFVKAVNREMIRENALCEVENLFDRAIEKSRMAGLSYEELEETLRMLFEERKNG